MLSRVPRPALHPGHSSHPRASALREENGAKEGSGCDTGMSWERVPDQRGGGNKAAAEPRGSPPEQGVGGWGRMHAWRSRRDTYGDGRPRGTLGVDPNGAERFSLGQNTCLSTHLAPVRLRRSARRTGSEASLPRKRREEAEPLSRENETEWRPLRLGVGSQCLLLREPSQGCAAFGGQA